MVSYQQFFGIVQEIADDMGASQSQHQNLASETGRYWSNNTRTVKSWTEAEARRWVRQNMTV